jgi:hypothetical protein
LWCTSLSKPDTGIALSCSNSVAPTPDQSYHPWPLELFFLNSNSPRTIELANSIGAGLGGTGSSLEETVVQEEGCSLGTRVSALQSHPKVMVFDERRKYFWHHLPPVAPQRDYMPPGSKQASPFKPDLGQLLFIATLSLLLVLVDTLKAASCKPAASSKALQAGSLTSPKSTLARARLFEKKN